MNNRSGKIKDSVRTGLVTARNLPQVNSNGDARFDSDTLQKNTTEVEEN